jgi:hypothetical protein
LNAKLTACCNFAKPQMPQHTAASDAALTEVLNYPAASAYVHIIMAMEMLLAQLS